MPPPETTQYSRRIALFGTMLTPWREPLKQRLAELGHVPIDNTDDRWPNAKTAEEIKPLLEQDHRLIFTADVVIWHHDAGTPGGTARIELGGLAFLSRIITIVHADPGVSSREYMRALTILQAGTLYWAETLNDAVTLACTVELPQLSRISRS